MMVTRPDPSESSSVTCSNTGVGVIIVARANCAGVGVGVNVGAGVGTGVATAVGVGVGVASGMGVGDAAGCSTTLNAYTLKWSSSATNWPDGGGRFVCDRYRLPLYEALPELLRVYWSEHPSAEGQGVMG